MSGSRYLTPRRRVDRGGDLRQAAVDPEEDRSRLVSRKVKDRRVLELLRSLLVEIVAYLVATVSA